MHEDKLEHDERLKLECIAQAVANNAMQRPSAEKIISDAKIFEKYIKGELDER